MMENPVSGGECVKLDS